MSAEIIVTKLAAARRQLSAAIRMFFSGEDELAIHTVASAAYGILKDLKSGRGRDEAADYHLTRIFYVVRDYRRGTLPETFTKDAEAMRWICKMAELLPITANSEFKDVNAQVSRQFRANFWTDRNYVANFLKHADRDARSYISLDGVDNLHLIMCALGAYIDLTNELIHPEGWVLFVYYGVITGSSDSMSDDFRKLAAKVEEIDPAEQFEFCAALLNDMKMA